MSVSRLLQPLPEIDTGLSDPRETLLLGALLIVGLTFVAAFLSIVSGLPALVFVAFVGTLYGIAILLLRRVLPGVLVAFIVTAGFAANVPLASNEYLRSVTGAIGPELWLAQPVLVVGLVVALFRGRRDVFRGATLAELLFAGFVGWSVLAALFGATVRTDVALYFSLLMGQLLVTLVLFRYAVQHRILAFRTVVQTFVGAVVAQSLFAIAQFVNGGTFGITTLGESGSRTISTYVLGPFGTLSAGTYVSGFTGGQFILASLIILALPVLLALSTRSEREIQAASVGGIVVTIVALRGTAGDAARGGLIVAEVSFAILTLYLYRSRLGERIEQIAGRFPGTGNQAGRSVLVAGAVSVLSIILILYPSSRAGDTSVDTADESGGDPSSFQPGSAGSGGTDGAQETTAPSITVPDSALEDLSVPFFDMSNLGVRLQQYVAGWDLFVRYPLFGVGGGNFRYYATRYGLPYPLPLHSIYMGLLAETGLPGLLFYTSAVVVVFWYGWQTIVEAKGEGLLLAGVLCGLLGYLSFGFFDYLQLIKPMSVFSIGILAGAVLGQYRGRTEQ